MILACFNILHYKAHEETINCVDSLLKLDGIEETPLLTMEAIAIKRGFIMSGKRIDYERTAKTVLDEFRSAAIGRITLEPLCE